MKTSVIALLWLSLLASLKLEAKIKLEEYTSSGGQKIINCVNNQAFPNRAVINGYSLRFKFSPRTDSLIVSVVCGRGLFLYRISKTANYSSSSCNEVRFNCVASTSTLSVSSSSSLNGINVKFLESRFYMIGSVSQLRQYISTAINENVLFADSNAEKVIIERLGAQQEFLSLEKYLIVRYKIQLQRAGIAPTDLQKTAQFKRNYIEECDRNFKIKTFNNGNFLSELKRKL